MAKSEANQIQLRLICEAKITNYTLCDSKNHIFNFILRILIDESSQIASLENLHITSRLLFVMTFMLCGVGLDMMASLSHFA